MKYWLNSAWMLSEQILTMFSGIFVGIYVARCIGPEKFGILSYTLAIIALSTVFSRLGMESILVRELVQKQKNSDIYMGTAFYLMLLGGVSGAVGINFFAFVFEESVEIRTYIFIISLGVIFQSFLVVDYSFQARVKAGFSSIAKSTSLLISAIIKIGLAVSDASLFYFALAYAIDYILVAFFLLVIYLKTKQPLFFSSFQRSAVKPLITSSFPMIISGISTIALVKTDQIMIKNMLDAEKLGVYVAASKIYEGWNTLLFVLSLSLMPLFVNVKKASTLKYEESFKIFFSVFFWGGILLAIPVCFMSETIMFILFGEKYFGSGLILSILFWAVPFSGVGFVATRYLIIEGMQKKVATRNWMSVALNVPLNYFLIGIYGMKGAAYATLASLFFAHFIVDYLDKDLKKLAKIKSEAIFFCWSKAASWVKNITKK